MSIFNKMYRGFMKDLGTHLCTLAIIGCTTAYLFTHDPYVPNEIEASSTEYIDPVSLKISQTTSAIHEELNSLHLKLHGLETKLDSANYLIDQKNSAR